LRSIPQSSIASTGLLRPRCPEPGRHELRRAGAQALAPAAVAT
jgi:hypothetical protein